jgi:hypothetical protein
VAKTTIDDIFIVPFNRAVADVTYSLPMLISFITLLSARFPLRNLTARLSPPYIHSPISVFITFLQWSLRILFCLSVQQAIMKI